MKIEPKYTDMVKSNQKFLFDIEPEREIGAAHIKLSEQTVLISVVQYERRRIQKVRNDAISA